MTTSDRKLIARYGKGFFYGLTIVLGIGLALSELDAGRMGNFLRFGLLVSGVFLIELFVNWLSRRSDIQTTIPHADRLGRYSALVHHLLIPISGYIAILGFSYFNRQASLRAPILFLALFTFTILFVNIRAYYDNRGALEHVTHYIYDVIKFLIFFGLTNVFLNLAILTTNIILPTLAITVLSFVLMSLILIRYKQLEASGIVLAAVFSFVLAVGLLVFDVFLNFNPLQLTLLAILAFYLSSAALHHLIKRDFSVMIGIEYLSVLAIALAILYGLS